MKKEIEVNGKKATIEIDLSQSQKERSMNGRTTHTLTVTSDDGSCNQELEIRVSNDDVRGLAELEEAITDLEHQTRKKLNALSPPSIESRLDQLGFK